MQAAVMMPYTRGMAKNTPAKVARFEAKLSAEGDATLRALAEHLGVSKAGVVEMALRMLARSQGIVVDGERGEAQGGE